MSNNIVTVFVTFPNMEDASRISTTLVSRDLVACSNIIPAGQSIYKMGDMVRLESESVALMITTRDKVDVVTQVIKEMHSLEVPCITTLPIDGGNEAYLQWVTSQTGHKIAAE